LSYGRYCACQERLGLIGTIDCPFRERQTNSAKPAECRTNEEDSGDPFSTWGQN